MRKFPSRKKLAKMDPLDRCADAIVRLRKAKSHRDAMLHFLTLHSASRLLPAPVAECFGIEAGMALARKYPDESLTHLAHLEARFGTPPGETLH